MGRRRIEIARAHGLQGGRWQAPSGDFYSLFMALAHFQAKQNPVRIGKMR